MTRYSSPILRDVIIDFDDTIANNTGFPEFKLQKPIKDARESIEELIRKGYNIVIFTVRPSLDYYMIIRWLKKYKIRFNKLICDKPLGRYYIDDRGIEFKGNWNKVLKKIKPL